MSNTYINFTFESKVDWVKKINECQKEIERLHSIIKEVREYIEENLAKDDNGCGCWWYSFEYYVNAKKELLGILDKENNNEDN